jgi:hypothetical protein
MNLHKRKQSPFWYARGSVDGEKFFLKTDLKWRKWDENPGPDAYAAWQRVRDAFAIKLAEKRGEKGDVKNMPLTLDVLQKLFFKEHESRHTREKTLQGYRWIWNSIRKNVDSIEQLVETRGLTEYAAKRSRMKSATTKGFISPNTIVHELKVIYSAWKYAKDFGLPLPDLPPWPKNFKRDADVDEARSGKYHPAKRIWAFINLLSSQEAKDRALFTALTGIRFEELARLDQIKLRVTQKYKGVAAFLILPAQTTKGARKRTIALTPDALAIYRRNLPFKSRTNRTAWRTASRKLGLPSPIHGRDLRTSFASGVTLAGASETHRDMVMGHWKGLASTYQKARWLAAAKVARAAGKWLAKGHASWVRGAAGVQSACVTKIGQI